MLFFDVFGNYGYLFCAVLSLFILIISAVQTRGLKESRGIILLTAALVCVFITSVLQHFSGFFYTHAVSAKVFAFTESLLVITGSLLLIMSSVWILFGKMLSFPYVISFVSFGLLLTGYAVVVADDANILADFRQMLPMVGMSCVFLSLTARPHLFHHLAFFTAGVASAAFIGLMWWPFFSNEVYAWYIPSGLILLLAFSFYMMVKDNLQEKLQIMEEERKKTAANIESIVKSSPFPIIISRLIDDRLILANRNAVKMFDLNENEMRRYHFKDFFVDAENRRLLTERLEKRQEVQDFEILVKSVASNTPFWLLVSANVVDYNNDVVLYSAFQNITDRKRREDILKTQADRDPLTSIYNRRFFEDRVSAKITDSHRLKQPFAMLMIDADKFKLINDTYGHKTGDKVLIELAAVCERTVRNGDVVARYGGEEFVVYLENITPESAEMVANRLRETIGTSVVYSEKGEPIRFSVSIGVAVSGTSDSVGMMIKMAGDSD